MKIGVALKSIVCFKVAIFPRPRLFAILVFLLLFYHMLNMIILSIKPSRE